MPDDIDWSDEKQRNEALDAMVQKRSEEAISGLKTKNQELLDKIAKGKTSSEEFDALKKQVEGLGGAEGLKNLTDFQQKIASDEKLKKLASGDMTQIQEVIDAETGSMRGNFENQIKSLNEQLEDQKANASKYLTQLQDSSLKSDLAKACEALSCLKGTSDEVFRHAKDVFVWDDERKQHVILENEIVKLGKDGVNPMTAAEWLDSTRETNSYRWAASAGGGAGGGKGGGGHGGAIDTRDMPQAEYNRLRKEGKI